MAIAGTIQFPALSATPSPPPVGNYVLYVKTDNTIYLEDSSGNVYSFGSTTAIDQLTGDVSAVGPGSAIATVNFVGGESAANVASATAAYLSATNLNTPNTLVLRDSSGNFSAGTITANLTGTATNATNAVTAVNFTGSLMGDVTGTQSATVVSFVGGSSAANVHSAELLANAATSLNTASTIVKRDASGNFSANTITANLNGTATNATTAVNFTGNLLGDVTGTQGATVVSLVGGQAASTVAAATVEVDAATSANTASTLVIRDASGNFSASTITASLTGNVTGNISGTAGNITATSNSTLTTLSSLILPTSQLSGDISLTTQVSGILPVPNGGTGQNSLTAHGVLLGEGTSSVGSSTAGTSGQVFVSGGSSADGAYAWSGFTFPTTGSTYGGQNTAPPAISAINVTVVGIGAGSSASIGSYNTLFGTNAGEVLSGTNCTLIGALTGNTLSSGIQNTWVGSQIAPQTITESNCIGIGYGCTVNASSIVMGTSAVTNAANQFVAGGSLIPMTDLYFGKGITNATPTLYTIHGTGGSGPNIAGADIAVAGGIGTGTGAGGNVIFQTAPASGVSGSTPNTLTELMRVSVTGVTLGPQTASTVIHRINGGLNYTTRTVTASTFTVDTTTTDYIIFTDSTSNAITITLPTATNGRTLFIQDKTGQAAANHITITPPGSVTINGVNASLLLGINYGGFVLVSDGTNWTYYKLAQLPSVQSVSGTVIDWSTTGVAGGLFTKTLSANTTFTFSNATPGQTIVIKLTNTASNYTVTWPTIKWPVQTTPVMTTGAFSDVYTIIYDGTTFFGSYVQNF